MKQDDGITSILDAFKKLNKTLGNLELRLSTNNLLLQDSLNNTEHQTSYYIKLNTQNHDTSLDHKILTNKQEMENIQMKISDNAERIEAINRKRNRIKKVITEVQNISPATTKIHTSPKKMTELQSTISNVFKGIDTKKFHFTLDGKKRSLQRLPEVLMRRLK